MRLARAEIEDIFGDRLTHKELAAGGPPWCSWELVATPAAREKLRSYLARVSPPWSVPADLPLLDVPAYGDSVVFGTLLEVLRKLPPPVVDYVTRRASFICVGGRMAGFFSSLPRFDDRPLLVVLTPGTRGPGFAREIAAHEIAHAWLEPEPTNCCMRAAASWALETQPIEIAKAGHVPMIAEYRAAQADSEKVARALVRLWGFEAPREESA